jgi:hypothetical protein
LDFIERFEICAIIVYQVDLLEFWTVQESKCLVVFDISYKHVQFLELMKYDRRYFFENVRILLEVKLLNESFFHEAKDFGPLRLFILIGSFELPDIFLECLQDYSVEISEILSLPDVRVK